MLISTLEVLEPFSVKRNGQVTTCAPGERLQLPHDKAQRLLEQVGDKVRLLPSEPSTTVIDPAAPHARPVWWESPAGQLRGPATPLFLAKTGTAAKEQFWVIVEYEGQTWWILDERLRSAPTRQEPARKASR